MGNLAGHTLGQYEVKELIGHGGMADVYKAFQPSMGRQVAIKVLPPEILSDHTTLERFKREVQLVAKLQHSHVLPVFEFSDAEPHPYIVMAFMGGGSLADRIRRHGNSIPLETVSRYTTQIATALDYAHSKDIIHRDLKPSNVLLDESGNTYLADFGIATLKGITADPTYTEVIGTPAYMAPELSEENGGSPLTDVYALSVTLFEMVTGQKPFQADTSIGMVTAHLTETIPDARKFRPSLPNAAQMVIEKGMAKDPAERFQSAEELAEALREAVSGIDMSSPEAPTQDWVTLQELPPRRTRQARRWIWLAGVAVLVIGVVLGWLLMFSGGIDLNPAHEIEPLTEGEQGQDSAADIAGGRGLTDMPTPTVTPAPTSAAPARFEEEVQFTRLGEGRIVTITISPDDSHIAVGGGVGLYVYDVNTFEEVWSGETERAVNALDFSPDGYRLVTVDDENVFVWDASSGKRLMMLEDDDNPRGMITVAFSPDGARIAGGSWDDKISIWAAETGEVLHTLAGHVGWVRIVAFSPDGTLLASGSDDGTVIVWDVETGERLNIFDSGGEQVEDLAFHPDGSRLACVALRENDDLIIWDVDTGEELLTINTWGASSVTYSPDGNTLVTPTYGEIVFWDPSTGVQLSSLGNDDKYYLKATFLSDGAKLASLAYDSTLTLWDAKTGVEVRSFVEHNDVVQSVAFSPDVELLAAGYENGRVRVWNLDDMELTQTLENPGRLHDLTFFPDSHSISVALVVDIFSAVVTWDMTTGEQINAIDLGQSSSEGYWFSPDGRQLATSGWLPDTNSGIHVFNTETGTLLMDFDHQGERLSSNIAISPRGSHIAAGTEGGTIFVWDMTTGNLLHTLNGHEGWVSDLDFSPDGLMLASVAIEDMVLVWDVDTGERLFKFVGGHNGSVWAVAFSPDGRWLASGGYKSVLLWELATGRQMMVLEEHTDGVDAVAFSPDGHLLASGSYDGTVIVWEIESQ